MKKSAVPTILFLILGGILGAQTLPSVASGDPSLSLWSNPAGLGQSDPGMEILRPLTSGEDLGTPGNWTNLWWSFHLPGVGFGVIKNGDQMTYKAAGALDFGGPLSMGISARWTGAQDPLWSASGRLRPLAFLSLGTVVDFPTGSQPLWTAALGLRPLAGWTDAGHRLTLTADWSGNGATWSPDRPLLGVELEPLDGLRFYGNWDMAAKTFQGGLSLRFSHQVLGGMAGMTDQGTFASGYAYAGLGASRSPTFFKSLLPSYVKLSGPLAVHEAKTGRWFLQEDNSGVSFRVLLEGLRAIKTSTSIQGLVLDHVQWGVNFPQAMEILGVLKELKAAGKKIYVYGDLYTRMDYLLASVADRVAISPLGTLAVVSYGTSNLYWKTFLQDWGIQVYNIRSSEYKTAGNPFSESAMTAPERERYESLFKDLEHTYLDLVRQGRGSRLKAPEHFLDQGPYLDPEVALKAGIVDAIEQPDQWEADLKKDLPSLAQGLDFSRERSPAWAPDIQPTVALIYAVGDILYGSGIQGRTIGNVSLAGAIKAARENPFVKGIILRIDSPGGSALASDLIARELELCLTGANKKPVVVSMGGYAASGGYYIAALADKIVAEESTITGSIGVLALIPNFSGLLEKGKIKADKAEAGANSAFASPFFPMKDQDKKTLEASIAAYYKRFVSVVAQGRNKSTDQVETVAQGQVWTGRQALDRGLVDQLGGLDTAVSTMKDLLGGAKSVELQEINPGDLPAPFQGFLAQAVTSEMGQVFSPELINELEKVQHARAMAQMGPLYWLEDTLSY